MGGDGERRGRERPRGENGARAMRARTSSGGCRAGPGHRQRGRGARGSSDGTPACDDHARTGRGGAVRGAAPKARSRRRAGRQTVRREAANVKGSALVNFCPLLTNYRPQPAPPGPPVSPPPRGVPAPQALENFTPVDQPKTRGPVGGRGAGVESRAAATRRNSGCCCPNFSDH